MKILRQLPRVLSQGESLPLDMIGAELIDIGACEHLGVYDLLAIRYQPKQGGKIRTLVLGIEDRGLWIESLT